MTTTANPCGRCRGEGRFLARDFDDDFGAVHLAVKCEDCDGTGFVSWCRRCRDVAALSELEAGGYLCVLCRIEAETQTTEAA